MVIEDNSPITVEKEDLLFDFTGNDNHSYTIGGKVTAEYEMVNPTDRSLSVQMAFPFIGSPKNLSSHDIAVKADNRQLPFDIYFGDIVDSYGNLRQKDKAASLDFRNIVKDITNDTYKAENFTESAKGKLFDIEVVPNNGERINFALDFNFSRQKTSILLNGFNRFERSERQTRIAAWCYKPETLEVFVLGDDIGLQANGYTDGNLEKKTDLFTFKITEREMELRPYLMELIRKDSGGIGNGSVSDIQLYNVYSKALDKILSENLGLCSLSDVVERVNSNEHILTIVYTVEFPPESRKNVSVSYNVTGTMDQTKTAKPVYTFDYILSPAKNWGSLNNLNIKIKTPKQAPFIAESNIEFAKEGDREYTAVLADLPEDELYFTLYANERITLIDKTAGKLQGIFGYLLPAVVGVMGIMLFLAAVLYALYKKVWQKS